MRHVILILSTLLLWLPACADPRCPADYILNQGRCKRCPEGSESHGDVCVSEGGVIVLSARGGDDEGGTSINAPSAEAGSQTVSTTDSGLPIATAPTPQLGDSGATDPTSSDAATTNAADASMDSAPATGVAPMIDPCQGMPGCVACTTDGQCPDPGACLVRHCNAAKSICEPTFAPAQAACGTSKCDGAGKCVGCLNDNDCGEPGECKVRYCNPSTRVCEPKNAPSTTSCPTGHCNQGLCVQCTTATECADQTCQTKSCVSGQCRYSNVPAGQKGTCATGVCTASQQCRECVGDDQCNRLDGLCAEGRCVANACQALAKSGSCGTGMVCDGMACEKSCGNGIIDSGEDCDPKVSNTWACNRDTCKNTGLASTTYRRSCTADSACAPGETCVTAILYAAANFFNKVCMPRCTQANACPTVPGYSMTNSVDSQCTAQMPCYVSCNPNASGANNCPPNVNCVAVETGAVTGVCGGPF